MNVLDAKAISRFPWEPLSETVTVEGGPPLINTQDATVSTVVDRQFAENLPINGRSFQTLIQLTPGVVVTSSNYDGQFSVNDQRPESNYWTVDGVLQRALDMRIYKEGAEEARERFFGEWKAKHASL